MTDTTKPRLLFAGTKPKLPFAGKPEISEQLRPWGDLLCLWRLCVKPACQQGRACKGDARRCFPRNFHLLPELVRAWYEGVGEYQESGVPFEETMEELDATEFGEAFRDWHEAVLKSLGEEGSVRPRWWVVE